MSRRNFILMGILSAIFFVIVPILVQKVPKSVSTLDLVWVRGLVATLAMTPLVFKDLKKLFHKKAIMVWARSWAGAFALICYFWNTAHGGAAEAKAFSSLSPFFVAILSWLIFKEKLTRFEILGLAISFFGVFWIIFVGYGFNFNLIPMVGLLGALLTGIAFMSLRQAAKNFSPYLIIWAHSVVMLLITTRSSVCILPSLDYNNLLIVFLIGLLALLGQITLTLSYVGLKAAVATSLSMLTLVLLVIYDYAVTGVIASTLGVFPYILILVGIGVMYGKKSEQH